MAPLASNGHVPNGVTSEGQSGVPDILECKYLETVRHKGSVLKNHQQEMAYRESNGHVTEIQDGGLADIFRLSSRSQGPN